MKIQLFVKDQKFYKMFFAVAMPVIAANVITIGVNMMDTIMLGSYGEAQLSGSSLANDFINVFQFLCMGLGGGAGVLTAQYYGSKDHQNLKKVITLTLRITLIVALVFMMGSIFLKSQIMMIYTSDPQIITQGSIYLFWSFPTFILTGITLSLTQILRSMADVKVPLLASVIGFVSNIFFNWVFIFGNLGAPEMQIAGAALGTVIARIFETSVIAIYFFKKERELQYRGKDLLISVQSVITPYIKYGIPVIASDSLLGFGNSAVSVIVGHLGQQFTAAYAIIAVIQRLATVFTSGMGSAAHTMTGIRIGEGETEKAYCEAVTMTNIAILIGLCAGVMVRLFGSSMVQMYNISSETYTMAMQMLNAISIMIVFQSIQSVLTKGVLRGGGDTKFCLSIDAVFLWIVSVPLGYYTGIVLHMSAFIILLSLKIDWAIKAILGLLRLYSRKWINNISLTA